MEETTQEFYKDRVQAQENRILELQQRNMDSNINEQSIDLDYDLYLEHEYLFLNVNLPGVLKQELKVELNQGEIIISGEFPNLCSYEEVEFLERQRPSGFFQKNFLFSGIIDLVNSAFFCSLQAVWSSTYSSRNSR